MRIRNYTYHNLMVVASRIRQKGYTQNESIDIAQRIFRDYNPYGLTIEAMTDRILPKKEWERENKNASCTI